MSDLGLNAFCDEQKLYNFIYDDVDDSDIFASEPLNTSSAESDLKSENEPYTLLHTTQQAENSAPTEALRQELEILQNEKALLELKISELYKTAKAEIDRKDKRLKELEKERDDILFKRGQHKFGTSNIKVESRVPVLQQVDNEEVNYSNLRYRIPKKKNPSISDHETYEPTSENEDRLKNMDDNIRKRDKHWSAYPYLRGTTSRYEDKYLRIQSDDKNQINTNRGRSKSRPRHNHKSPEFHRRKPRTPSRERDEVSDKPRCEDGNIKSNDEYARDRHLEDTREDIRDPKKGQARRSRSLSRKRLSRSKSRRRPTHSSPEFNRGKPRTPSRERDRVSDKARSICEDENIKLNDDHSNSKTRTKSASSDSYAHNRKNRSKSRDHDSENSKRTIYKLEDRKETLKNESDIPNQKEKYNTRPARSSSKERQVGDARDVIRDHKKEQSRRSRSLSRERIGRSKSPYLIGTTSRYEDKYLRTQSDDKNQINTNRGRSKSRPRHNHKSPEFQRRKPRTPSRERDEDSDKPRCEDGNIKANDEYGRDRHIEDSREVIRDPKKGQSRRSRSLSRKRSKSRRRYTHGSPEFNKGKPRTPSRERDGVLDKPRSICEDGNIKLNDHSSSKKRTKSTSSAAHHRQNRSNSRDHDGENSKRNKNELEYIEESKKSESDMLNRQEQYNTRSCRSSSRERHTVDAREVIRDSKNRQPRRSRSLSRKMPSRSKSQPRYKLRSPEFQRGRPRTPSRELDEVSDKPRSICEDGNIKLNDHSSLKTRTKSTSSDSYANNSKNRSKSGDHASENFKRSNNKLEDKKESKRSDSDQREINRDLNKRQSRRSRSLSRERDTRQNFKRGRSVSKGRFLRKSPEKRNYANKNNQTDRNYRDGISQNYSQRNSKSSSEEREGSKNYQIEDNNTVRRDRYGNILQFKYNDYRNRPKHIERPSRLQHWQRASRPTNVRRLRERLMRHSVEKESAALRNVLKENKSRCMDSGRIDNETDHSDLDDLKLHLSGESDLDSLKHHGNAKDKRDEQTHSEDDEDLELLKNLGLDAENMTDEQLEKLLEERKQELKNNNVLHPSDTYPDKVTGVQHASDYKHNMGNRLSHTEKGNMFEDQNYSVPTNTKKNVWNPFDVNEDLDYEMSPIEHKKEETYFRFDTKCKKTNNFHESHRNHHNMDGVQINQINNKKESLDDDPNKPTFRTVFEARQHKKITVKVGSNSQNDEPLKINRVNTHIEQDTVRKSLKPMLKERRKSLCVTENKDGIKADNLHTTRANLDNKKLIKMTQKFTEQKIEQLKVQCSMTSEQVQKLKVDVTDNIAKSRLSSESKEKGIDESRLIKLIIEDEKQAVVSSKPKEKITLSAYKKRTLNEDDGSKKTDKLDNCETNVSKKVQLKTNTCTNDTKSARTDEHIENNTNTISLKIETKTPKNSKDIHSSSTLPNNVLISDKETQSIQNSSIETSNFSNKNIEEQPMATDNITVKDLTSELLNQNKNINERDNESKDVSSVLHDLSISDDEDEVPVRVISTCDQEEKVENEADKKIKILSNIAIQNSTVNLSNVPTSNEPIEKSPLIINSILNKSVEKVECIEEIQQAVSNIMILNNSKPKSPLNKTNKLNTEELQKCLEEDLDQMETNSPNGNIEKTDKAKRKIDRIEVVTNKRNANIVFISSPLKREMKSKRQIRMTLLPEEKSPDMDKVTAEINNDDTMQRLFGYMTPSPCKFYEKIPNEPNKEKVKRKVIDENDYDAGGDMFKIRDKSTEDVQVQGNINKCVNKEDGSQLNSKVKQHIRQRSKSVDEKKFIEIMQMEEISNLQNGGQEMENGEKLNNWQKFSNNPTYIPNLKEKKIVAFDSPNHYIQKKNQEIIKRRRQSLDAKLLDINNDKNKIVKKTPDLSINLNRKLEDENVNARITLNPLEKDIPKTKQSKQNKSHVSCDQKTEIKQKKKKVPDPKKVNCNLKLNKPKKQTKNSPLKKTKSPGFKIKLVQQKRQKNNTKDILPNKKRKVNMLVSESSKSESELDEIKEKKDLKMKKVKKNETKAQKVKQDEKEISSKVENTITKLGNSHNEKIMVTLPGNKRKPNILLSESSNSDFDLDETKVKKDLNVKKITMTKTKTQKVIQNEKEITSKDKKFSMEISNSEKEQIIETLLGKRKVNILVSESSKSESDLDENKVKKDLNVKKITKTETKTQKVIQNEKEITSKDERFSTEISNSEQEQIMKTLPGKKRKVSVLVSESSKSESELDEVKDKKDLNVNKITKTETKTQKVKHNEKEINSKDESTPNTRTELSNSHKEQIMETFLKESNKIGITKKEIKNLKDNQEETEKVGKTKTQGEINKRHRKAQKESVCINIEKDVRHDILDKKTVPVLTKGLGNLEQPILNDTTNDEQESFKTIKRITPKRIGDSSFKMKNEVLFNKDLKAKRELFSGNSCTEPMTANKRKHPSTGIEDSRPEKVQKLVYKETTRTVEDHVMDNASHTHIKIHETQLDIEVAPNSSPLPRIEQTYEACTKANSGSSKTDHKSPFIDVKNPQLQPSHEGVFPDIHLHTSNSTFNEINLDTKDIDMLGEVERAIYFNLPDMSMSDKSLLTLGGEKKGGKDSGDSIIGRDRDGTNVKDKDHLSFSNFLNKNDNTSTPIRSRPKVSRRPSIFSERDAKHEKKEEENKNQGSVIESSNKPVVNSENIVPAALTVASISVSITKTSSVMSVGERTNPSSISQSYNKFGAPLKRDKRKRIIMKLID